METIKNTTFEELVKLAIKAQHIKEASWDEKSSTYGKPTTAAIEEVLEINTPSPNEEQIMQFEILWILTETCWNDVQRWHETLNKKS